MAEQPETPKVLDELSKSNSARPTSRTDRQKRTAMKRIALILVFISPLLLGVIYLGYQQWMLRSDMRDLADENSKLNSVINGDNERVQQLEALLNEQSTLPASNEVEIGQLESEFAQEISQLNATVADLQSQLSQSRIESDDEWKLAEAEYLLRAANQRMQIEPDPDIAIELLQSADRVLAELDDNKVFPARQAISTELAQLRAMGWVDTEEVYLKLGGLIAQLDALAIETMSRPDFQSRLAGERDAQPGTDGERGILNASLDFLGSVFIWRRWDETPDRMLRQPGQGQYQKENLSLLLQQLQLAVLNRQAGIYRSGIERSLNLLDQLPVSDPAPLESLRAGLGELQQLNLQAEVPDISRSLSLVRQLNAGTPR